MSYTGVLMTENAFYPVFLLSVLLIARAVRGRARRTRRSPCSASAIVAFTRIQGVALVGAYVAALRLFALTGAASERRAVSRARQPDCRARRARVARAAVSPRSRGATAPFGWLGARSGTFDQFHPGEIPQWFVYLTGDLVLYVAVAPLAATAV